MTGINDGADHLAEAGIPRRRRPSRIAVTGMIIADEEEVNTAVITESEISLRASRGMMWLFRCFYTAVSLWLKWAEMKGKIDFLLSG